MTAKEAVESLMSKDPYNPTLKSLKRQGLLKEILNPDGAAGRQRYEEPVVIGTGKRERSIAKKLTGQDAALSKSLFQDPFAETETLPEITSFTPSLISDFSGEKPWKKVSQPLISSSNR